MSTDFGIAKIVDKYAYRQGRRKANELRKMLLSSKTIIVTLVTGSIYTMVEFDPGLFRFKGMCNGKPGTFHISFVKSIQNFEQTKEGE